MIERNEQIRFHEKGTLDAVTRWVSGHPDGLAEWLKNVRRQYQTDRANVGDGHRVAVLLLKDEKQGEPSRIGLLDVGGATLEDVTAWSTWQDPEASSRGSSLAEEQTQGNGGKAYMFRLFEGPARILGVRDGRLNCKGFDGPPGSVDRGTPGWIPSVAAGRDLEISSFDAELAKALQPYGIDAKDLPKGVQAALLARKSFTLVEGVAAIGAYKGRIDIDDLIAKLIRHEQSVLCLEQLELFAIHNGSLINGGKPLTLPSIPPYPGLESPTVFEIPEELPMDDGQLVSTTENGAKPRGRLTLHTSKDHMPNAHKNLRPRWQMQYRTRHQMIGARSIGDIAPSIPGAAFIYGTVELAALEPAYVEHGRRRPKPGPLTEALDRFIGEKIRELAAQINARRRQELDAKALDQVQKENELLDEFKNKFLPDNGDGAGRATGNESGGGGGGGGGPTTWGDVPDTLDLSLPADGIHLGKGVSVDLRTLLRASVRDAKGYPVRAAIEWSSSNAHVAKISTDGALIGVDQGTCSIQARVKGSSIKTDAIDVKIWSVDHVLLTPRQLDIPLGSREQITAEVTDDAGSRSTQVILDWQHDAEDQLIVRIGKLGTVTANRIGRTAVTAGADGVWARIPVEIRAVESNEDQKKGGGLPRLLLTGRDIDPASGTIREGDPDQPALWQEASDYMNNVWWLNLQSPEAAFAFRERGNNPEVWRSFHAQKLIDMVVQVWMSDEFTKKGEQQRPDFWGTHQIAMDRHRVRIVQEMWKGLQEYVQAGELGPEENVA